MSNADMLVRKFKTKQKESPLKVSHNIILYRSAIQRWNVTRPKDTTCAN